MDRILCMQTKIIPIWALYGACEPTIYIYASQSNLRFQSGVWFDLLEGSGILVLFFGASEILDSGWMELEVQRDGANEKYRWKGQKLDFIEIDELGTVWEVPDVRIFSDWPRCYEDGYNVSVIQPGRGNVSVTFQNIAVPQLYLF